MKYSLPGYKIAVQRRAGRTILVEGTDDQKILQRILAGQDDGRIASDRRPIVDHAHIVEDPVFHGLGNRSKVIQVSREVDRSIGKFVALVDREWEGFDDNRLSFLPEYGPIERVLSRTRGHSVENYFFSSAFFIDYLLREHPAHATYDLRRQIEARFKHAVELATDISLAARDAGLLGVVCSSLSEALIRVQVASFELDVDGLCAKLSVKGCETERIERFGTAFAMKRAVAKPLDFNGQWVAHGHVGFATIWCCIGALALCAGCDHAAAHQIAVGYSDQKRNAFAHFLALSESHEKGPLDRLAKWACGRHES